MPLSAPRQKRSMMLRPLRIDTEGADSSVCPRAYQGYQPSPTTKGLWNNEPSPPRTKESVIVALRPTAPGPESR